MSGDVDHDGRAGLHVSLQTINFNSLTGVKSLEQCSEQAPVLVSAFVSAYNPFCCIAISSNLVCFVSTYSSRILIQFALHVVVVTEGIWDNVSRSGIVDPISGLAVLKL